MSAKHRRGLDPSEVGTVETPSLRACLRLGAEAIGLGGILVATGPPGTGKTFAVVTLCEQLPNWLYVPVDPGTTPHRFLHRLLDALGDTQNDPGLRGHVLEEVVIEGLAARRPVLVIDDANFLGRDLIAQFIFLQASADFALVLVGHGMDRLLRRHDELDTRVTRTVAFRRVRAAQVIETLAAYHEVFARSDPQVLRDIDAHFARGNFRRWAAVLEVVLSQHRSEARDGIPAPLVGMIIGRLSGGRFGRPTEEVA